MNQQEALVVLKAKLDAGQVPPKDLNFVTNLVTKNRTPNMWVWVVKMAERYTAGPAPVRTVASFTRVYAMLAKAKEHLLHPKVVLKTAAGEPVKLYLSGQKSRVPNTVNVVSHRRDDEEGTWFGRVYEDGKWEGGRGTADQTADVEELLTRFSADPEKVAAEYGKLHGNCCFCMRPLSDERSTEVGYGPTCADNFGLAWGNKPKRVRVLRQL